MRIGIYARGLSTIGGVKQYIESMTKSMIEAIDDRDELFVIHNAEKNYFPTEKENVREIRYKTKNRIVADFVLAPKTIKEHRLDTVWFTKSVVPFGTNARAFVTIHDMAYYLPEFNAYRFTDTVYMRSMIRNSCRRADRIIAVSQNTKKDIVKILAEDEKKIEVIYEAADKKYRRLDESRAFEAFRKRYELPPKYLLFTGGISPRKNLLRLIDAFARIQDKIGHELILTGGKGWNNKDILEKLRATPRVRRIGFVNDEDMPLLYNCADLFVYPSLYEGFGLPILEAQKCGCPVLCGKSSSLTEVGGDAVHYIDPYDVQEMADEMLRMLLAETEKENTIEKGFANSNRFSWDDSAARLLECMRRSHA